MNQASYELLSELGTLQPITTHRSYLLRHESLDKRYRLSYHTDWPSEPSNTQRIQPPELSNCGKIWLIPKCNLKIPSLGA